jgi:hypothetical protein
VSSSCAKGKYCQQRQRYLVAVHTSSCTADAYRLACTFALVDRDCSSLQYQANICDRALQIAARTIYEDLCACSHPKLIACFC